MTPCLLANKAERFVDATASFGLRCVVWHYAVVLGGVICGDDVSIGSRTEIGFHSKIGARSRIGSGVFLPANSQVGTDVFIGPNCTFTDDRYPKILKEGERYNPEPPIIEDGASIGAGAVILPGVRIGFGAQVGAGSVVTRDVAPYTLVYGEKAKPRTTQPL